MNKIWYVLINGNSEGPLSFDELKNDHRITPDTLAWKEGFDDWRKIRDIQELKELFEENPNQIDESELQDLEKKTSEEELVLDMREEPPYFLWALIAFISLAYVILQLYAK